MIYRRDLCRSGAPFAEVSSAIMAPCVWYWIPFGSCISLAGFLNQRQQDVIEYLHEENRVLREQLGGNRLHLGECTQGRSRW